MSFEMVLPQFYIRLCGPTSTSCQIEVATKFATSKGMVIQLNNDHVNNYVRGFDCSLISRFKEEDERYDKFRRGNECDCCI